MGKDKSPRLKPEEQRAQAVLMMTRRLMGQGTVAELAKEFGVDEKTVQRRLSLAEKEGIAANARDVFIREMLPQSMAVLQQALAGDDLKLAVQVALKIVEGLKALEGPAAAVTAAAAEETLEVWKAKFTRRSDAPVTAEASETVRCPGPPHREPPGDALDAEFTALPPAAPTCAEAGGPDGTEAVRVQPSPSRSEDPASAAAAPDAGGGGSEGGV